MIQVYEHFKTSRKLLQNLFLIVSTLRFSLHQTFVSIVSCGFLLPGFWKNITTAY